MAVDIDLANQLASLTSECDKLKSQLKQLTPKLKDLQDETERQKESIIQKNEIIKGFELEIREYKGSRRNSMNEVKYFIIYFI